MYRSGANRSCAAAALLRAYGPNAKIAALKNRCHPSILYLPSLRTRPFVSVLGTRCNPYTLSASDPSPLAKLFNSARNVNAANTSSPRSSA